MIKILKFNELQLQQMFDGTDEDCRCPTSELLNTLKFKKTEYDVIVFEINI